MKGKMMSVAEAASLLNIGKQAVFHAMKRGRIHGEADVNGMVWIEMDEVIRYDKSRWIRKETTMMNGHKIFEDKSEYMSVAMVGDSLSLNRNQVYYLVKRGELKPYRVGSTIAIKKSDVEAFKQELPRRHFWVATA